jgi:hypothetical protein
MLSITQRVHYKDKVRTTTLHRTSRSSLSTNHSLSIRELFKTTEADVLEVHRATGVRPRLNEAAHSMVVNIIFKTERCDESKRLYDLPRNTYNSRLIKGAFQAMALMQKTKRRGTKVTQRKDPPPHRLIMAIYLRPSSPNGCLSSPYWLSVYL